MSKRFRRQDAAFYKRLGTKWRKPKGHQSKLRVKKGGSGMLPRIGYGSKEKTAIPVICSEKELVGAKAVRIGTGVGAKRVLVIAEAAKERGVKILNMKKIKRAERIAKIMQEKKALQKSKTEEKKKDESKTEKTAVKKEETTEIRQEAKEEQE